MSLRTPSRVLKLTVLGAVGFWFPDALFHAFRGLKLSVWDILLVSVTMPLTFLGACVLAAKQYKGESRKGLVGLLIAGVWLFGGLIIMLGGSFSGGGFASPNFSWHQATVTLALAPIFTFLLSTYDYTLPALLIVSGVALTIIARKPKS